MDTAAINAANGGAVGSGSGVGNQALTEAFDYAINQAQTTLNITTKKGADLYAMKQRPQ